MNGIGAKVTALMLTMCNAASRKCPTLISTRLYSRTIPRARGGYNLSSNNRPCHSLPCPWFTRGSLEDKLRQAPTRRRIPYSCPHSLARSITNVPCIGNWLQPLKKSMPFIHKSEKALKLRIQLVITRSRLFWQRSWARYVYDLDLSTSHSDISQSSICILLIATDSLAKLWLCSLRILRVPFSFALRQIKDVRTPLR